MRKTLLIALGLFILGIALLAVSVAQGGGTVYLALIFPIYVGSDVWGFFGILCVIGAFFVGFLGLVPARLPAGGSDSGRQGAPPSGGPEKRFGGVVMLGPVPIIVGSDVKMSMIAIVLAIVLIIVLMVSMVLFIPGILG
ncbi:MAG: DUF131 domain-containing protein [Thermoplasmata archaeon]|nr:DUF131 domain-containing protein [Thermoplasmata archaeon]